MEIQPIGGFVGVTGQDQVEPSQLVVGVVRARADTPICLRVETGGAVVDLLMSDHQAAALVDRIGEALVQTSNVAPAGSLQSLIVALRQIVRGQRFKNNLGVLISCAYYAEFIHAEMPQHLRAICKHLSDTSMAARDRGVEIDDLLTQMDRDDAGALLHYAESLTANAQTGAPA